MDFNQTCTDISLGDEKELRKMKKNCLDYGDLDSSLRSQEVKHS